MSETTIDKGPPKDMGLSGMGRADLEREVLSLRAQLADQRALQEAVDGAAARWHRSHDAMKDTLTEAQRTNTRQVEELRIYRGGMLEALVTHIAKARAKYPKGCTVLSLLDEAGEVAHAVNKHEDVERVREELLDVAGVAMRLYFGECDEALVVEGLTQRRAEK